MIRENDGRYIRDLKTACQNNDSHGAVETARRYIRENPVPGDFFYYITAKTLRLIEEEWSGRLVSLTDVYRVGKVMEAVVNYLLEHYKESYYKGHRLKGRNVNIVIATFNDWHEFGRIVVASFLKFEGYNVEDIGMIPALATLVEKVAEKKPDILAISVLMINSALRLANLREKLDAAGCKDVKIIIGGAPFFFDTALARRFKFDGYGVSPFEALALVKKVMGEK
ncbi:MAG: cobalamin B12-binding domain-containing protein [Candidatus Omnitrophota bacterium]